MNLEMPNAKEKVEPDENLMTSKSFIEKTKEKIKEITENLEPYFNDSWKKGERYFKIALFSLGAFAAQESNAQEVNNAEIIKNQVIESVDLDYAKVLETLDNDTYKFPESFSGNEFAFSDTEKKIDQERGFTSAFKVAIPEDEIEEGVVIRNLAVHEDSRMSSFNLNSNDDPDTPGFSNSYKFETYILQSKEDNIIPNGEVVEFTSIGRTKQQALLGVLSEAQQSMKIFTLSMMNTQQLDNNTDSEFKSSFTEISRAQSLEYFDSIEIIDIKNDAGKITHIDDNHNEINETIVDGYTITIKVNFGELVESSSDNK